MASQDLTTLPRVKAHLGIKDTDTNSDSILTWLITAASQWVIKQLGDRPIKSADYTDFFDGDGSRSLTLRHAPVTAVSRVQVDDDDPIPARATVTGEGYVEDNGRLKLTPQYAFTPGIKNVEVRYTAGYATVPEDLEQAVVMWVAELHRGRDRTGLASRSSPQGDTLSFRPDAVPVYVDLTMQSYKRLLGVPQ